jgi:ABC-2 type transport system permease protein
MTTRTQTSRPDARRSLLTLLANETRAELTKALRSPAFVLPTLALPLAFYSLFGIVLAPPGSGSAGYLLATFGVFAGLGPALFGFGAAIADERARGVLALKQVSPLPVGVFLGAKLATALVFTGIVLIGLYALAALWGGVALPRPAWLLLAVIQLLGVVPFCLLGLCIGLGLTSSAAMGVTNLVFMVLAVLGGLWIPIMLFPGWMQAIGSVLPTYHVAALALQATGRTAGADPWLHVAVISASAAIFAAVAWRAWRAMPR